MALDCGIHLPDCYVDYTNDGELSYGSDWKPTPYEYTKLPCHEAEEDFEIEMRDEYYGNDVQSRRLMRASNDTKSDYAYSYLPTLMDYLSFIRSDTGLAGFPGDVTIGWGSVGGSIRMGEISTWGAQN